MFLNVCWFAREYLRMCTFLLVCIDGGVCVCVCVCVCEALTACLCVCMCFAHSQSIFILAVISTVVHVFLGGFRQGHEKHVENLIFSGNSVYSNLQSSWLGEELVPHFPVFYFLLKLLPSCVVSC